MLFYGTEKTSLLKLRFSKTVVKKDPLIRSIFKNIQELAEPLSKKSTESEEYVSKTKRLLMQAGFASSEEDVLKYETQKVTYMMMGLILGMFLLLVDLRLEVLITAILITYIAYKYPEIYLKKMKKNRQKEMMKFLPDAIDLLSICVQAGLGLDAAFTKVAEEFSLTSEVVSNEFARLNRDILTGLSHQDAYKNLLARNDSTDLHSFVALLIQSDKLGTSITQSLEAFCDSMRTKKKQRIEELSQQASTKMTIPMVLFMLPAIFLIIMYPAIQKIMENFH